jgi:PAS domain S-box-containing protein
MNPSSDSKSSLTGGSLGGKQIPAFLANFVEHSLDPIVAYNSQGRIIYWNPAAEQMFGWGSSETWGKSSTELFWPADSPQEQEDQWQRQLRLDCGEIVQGEHIMQRKEGSPLWVKYSIRAVIENGSANGISGYVAVYRDITKQKQAEEQLERSNQKLSEILASVQDDFYVLDRDWNFVYANRLFTSRVGKEPEDFVGNNIWKMFPKHLGTALEENFRAAMEKREIRRFDIPGKYTNAWYKTTAFPSAEGITVLGSDITEHKHMEREIESLARFPKENPNPILRIHRDGVITFANAASGNLLRLWNRVVGERLPELEHKLISQTLESRTAIEQEVDCAGRIYSLIFTPIADSGYVNIYGRDITERVQAEEALRQARTDLERAQEVGQIGSWRLDVRQNVLTWSEENHRIFGVPVGTPMSYESFLGIVHPDDRQYVDTQWNAGLAGAPYDIEHRIVVDGRVNWVREKAYLEFDDAGNLLGGFGITQDITERKQAEDKLRASEKRFRSLANTVPSIVWTAAPDGTILFTNEYWHKYTGTSYEDAGSNWTDFLHPDDFKRSAAAWTRAVENISDYFLETRLRRYDGQYRWFQASALPVRDDRGNVTAWYGVSVDIHAMRESQQQLQLLNEALEQKVSEQTAEVRRLASELTKVEQRERQRIAHILHEDLQQRLYAVKMRLALLLDRLKVDSAVEREILEMDKQLAEILSLTRHLTVELSPPILRDEGLTQAITWLADQMYEKQGLHIEIQAEESFAVANEAIQVLLFNCVRELLFNTVKHAGVNRALVVMKRSEADLVIEVRDAGKGFNVAALEERIKSDDRGPKQWSFGLTTLRHQLSLVGGQMDVQSGPDTGTCITITIPYS